MASDEDATGALSNALDLTEQLRKATDMLGKSIVNVFSQGIIQGRRFEDMLRSIGQRMINVMLRMATKPLESALQSFLGSLIPAGLSLGGAGANVLPSAKGNAFRFGSVTPFAAGGVVAAPTYFPMRGGLGLMGERGPEAVMPLSRGPDGKLGVRAASAPTTITVNIATPDVESFRRSEAQVAGALARAVARGRRAV